jgi:hypothetical protein
MSFLTFTLTFAGLGALSLSMNRHARDALHKEWARPQRLALRTAGGLLLAISLLLSTRIGWSVGVLQWLGMIAACGFCCACLLTYLPRLLVMLALGLPTLAITAIIGACLR